MSRQWTGHIAISLLIAGLPGCGEQASDSAYTAAVADEATTSVAVVTETKNGEAGTATKLEETGPAESLTIGDVAPSLQLASWFQGDVIHEFAADHIYVVEFWATWCGPCKTSMPHLSKLQEKHANDVTFMGVTSEDADTVAQFFSSQQSEQTTWDEIVTYSIAIEGKNMPMTESYMEASGQMGIPAAFIIGRTGRLEWIGHPAEIDAPIAAVVAGTWDRQAELEYTAAIKELGPMVQAAYAAEDWRAPLELVLNLTERYPAKMQLSMLQADLLIRADRASEGVAVLRKMADSFADDPHVLDGIAWTVAVKVPASARDLDWALEIATTANDLADNANPSVLDTIARIHYEQGSLDEAILWQRQAVDASGGAASLQRTLDKFTADRAAAIEAEESMDREENDLSAD